MRCPKCRCEVGNQSICPFCGATVFVSNTTWGVHDMNRQPTVAVRGMGQLSETRGIERKLRNLETKVNLLLVLQSGTFALAVIALLVLALT